MADQKRQSDPGLVVSRAVKNLRDISLVEMEAHCNREKVLGDGPVSVHISVDPKVESTILDRGLVALRVRFEMRTSIDGPNDMGSEEPMRMSAVFRLEYEVASLSSFDSESLEAFAKLNGVYNAWPYWRELVQSTAGRFGVPPIVVPVFQPLKPRAASDGTGSDRPESSTPGS